jgi:beta-aspartyl-peptidase (threonine type)
MPAIAVHGGAGPLPRSEVTPEAEAAYRAVLGEALDAGWVVLEAGGSALDAVQAAVTVLEDTPVFNAGRGAVFTHEGRIELDAAIMDGATGAAGAVAGVRHVRNPVRLARRVMDSSPHVLLIGEGADAFAVAEGFEEVPQEYFETDRRRAQLADALRSGSSAPDSMGYFGTVGAVALDADGHLAAATSTGGMTNKRFGRVGDSPIIGAGTYASDATCAVSATGHGEHFIRGVVGHEINALVGYRDLPLAEAVRTVIHDQLAPRGGGGGVIAIGVDGTIALDFNTDGMFRGSRATGGVNDIAIYR